MENERARLERIYSEMSDLELLEIAAQEKKLSEGEEEVLEQELRKRNLNAEIAPEVESEIKTPKPSGPLVLVKRFTTLAAASLAKSVLDSAKIDSILTGEKIMGMVYPNLIGAVKLLVRPEDLDVATELLSRTERSVEVTETDETQTDETDLAKILRGITHRTGEKSE